MEGIDWKEAICGSPNWLRDSYRHVGSFTTRKETVAEHSYFVALYAWMIGQSVESRTPKPINFELIFGACVLHDFEEGFTGDFPRPFKYGFGEEFRLQLSAASQRAAEYSFRRLSPVDGMIQTRMLNRWGLSKDDKIESFVISLADFAALLSYVWIERHNGNQSIVAHLTKLRTRYTELSSHPLAKNFWRVIDTMERIVREVETGITVEVKPANYSFQSPMLWSESGTESSDGGTSLGCDLDRALPARPAADTVSCSNADEGCGENPACE